MSVDIEENIRVAGTVVQYYEWVLHKTKFKYPLFGGFYSKNYFF